jgi:hypothetical protein
VGFDDFSSHASVPVFCTAIRMRSAACAWVTAIANTIAKTWGRRQIIPVVRSKIPPTRFLHGRVEGKRRSLSAGVETRSPGAGASRGDIAATAQSRISKVQRRLKTAGLASACAGR